MIDNHIEHLYPPFRLHIEKMLEDVNDDYIRRVIPYRYVINEGFRSLQRQAELYAQGRTTPGPRVTQLRVGLHSTGLACDWVPVNARGQQMWDSDARFMRIGYYTDRHGIEWGGHWHHPDYPHTEPIHAEMVKMLPDAIEWCRKNGLYPDGKIPHFDTIPR